MGWFVRYGAQAVFEKFILPLAGQPLRYLEIGTWGGDSVAWVAEHVLSHAESKAIAVDPFARMRRHEQEEMDRLCEGTRRRLAKFDNVTFVRQFSSWWLRRQKQSEQFDVIYVDGDHCSFAVLDDTVLAWPLLKQGGVMIWDDYGSRRLRGYHVRNAVDAFGGVYANFLTWEYQGYQVVARKRESVGIHLQKFRRQQCDSQSSEVFVGLRATDTR